MRLSWPDEQLGRRSYAGQAEINPKGSKIIRKFYESKKTGGSSPFREILPVTGLYFKPCVAFLNTTSEDIHAYSQAEESPLHIKIWHRARNRDAGAAEHGGSSELELVPLKSPLIDCLSSVLGSQVSLSESESRLFDFCE